MTQMGRMTIKKNVTNKAERAIYRNSSGKLKFPLSQPTLLSRRRNEIEYMCRILFQCINFATCGQHVIQSVKHSAAIDIHPGK